MPEVPDESMDNHGRTVLWLKVVAAASALSSSPLCKSSLAYTGLFWKRDLLLAVAELGKTGQSISFFKARVCVCRHVSSVEELMVLSREGSVTHFVIIGNS